MNGIWSTDIQLKEVMLSLNNGVNWENDITLKDTQYYNERDSLITFSNVKILKEVMSYKIKIAKGFNNRHKVAITQ